MAWTSKLLVALCLLPSCYLALQADRTKQFHIAETLVVSSIGFFISRRLIPALSVFTKRAGMHGMDMNKKGTSKEKIVIPEGLGIVPGTIYLCCIILFQTYQFFSLPSLTSVAEYNAALTSICFMIFLGFADDVLDLPWRFKLILPAIASLPLLVTYGGPTSVVVPIPLREWLGVVVELGFLYRIYMLLISIFCTNSINILAGINGLEAGQSFVIACAILTHNMLEIDGPSAEKNLFSVILIIPFIAVTLSLLEYNWYPSQVFVGDTFTTFAGMVLAVAGILCHQSKTMMLFFIPQLLNFVYSLPQLLRRGCPRHRLPRYNAATGKLETVWEHWNLINLTLLITGPLTEKQLATVLMVFQAVCCCAGLLVRHYIAGFVYGGV